MSFLPKSEQNRWFSTTLGAGDEDIPPYCSFCFNNFKKYYELVQNICTMCGRAAPKITENETAHTKITAINDPIPDDGMRGAMLEIDYSKLYKDETIKPNHSSTRMQANSIGEAMQMLREADKPTTNISGHYQDKYSVKVKKNTGPRLDSPAIEGYRPYREE